MSDSPLVSVCTVTYNHAKYIAQCLEGALIQETTFEYEILVGEDDSSDGTREICKEYAAKNPDKIRLFLNDRKNVIYIDGRPTGRWNFINLLKNAKGKYIALCEGDDYWTDSYKLQKQVNFLETHVDFVLCCHPVKIEYSDDRQKVWDDVVGRWEGGALTIEDIICLPNRPELPTVSMLFRNLFQGRFPEWFHKTIRGDSALHLLLAHHGKVGFLTDVMAVHRKHDGGMSKLFETDQDFMDEQLLILYRYFDRHCDYKYHRLLAPLIADGLKKKVFACRQKDHYGRALLALLQLMTLKTGVPQEIESKVAVLLGFFGIQQDAFIYRCAQHLNRSRLAKALKSLFPRL